MYLVFKTFGVLRTYGRVRCGGENAEEGCVLALSHAARPRSLRLLSNTRPRSRETGKVLEAQLGPGLPLEARWGGTEGRDTERNVVPTHPVSPRLEGTGTVPWVPVQCQPVQTPEREERLGLLKRKEMDVKCQSINHSSLLGAKAYTDASRSRGHMTLQSIGIVFSPYKGLLALNPLAYS
jgi:hypothetical protein